MICACCFCARPPSDAELIFRSSIGGAAPVICDSCVLLYAEVIDTYRKAPGLADALIRAINGSVAQRA